MSSFDPQPDVSGGNGGGGSDGGGGVTSVFLHAPVLHIAAGSGALLAIDSYAVGRNPTDGSFAAYAGGIVIPAGWNTMKVEALVTSVFAGDGVKTQVLRIDYAAEGGIADGEVIPNRTLTPNSTIVAPVDALTVSAVTLLDDHAVTEGALFPFAAGMLNTATQGGRVFLGVRFTKLT